MSLADWLLSATLARFRTLNIAYSESQIGWMPYLLERIDRLWEDGHASYEMNPLLTERPSTYFTGRVFGCFFEDDFGLLNRDAIGVDQITFESDYPHSDSTWPNTRQYAERAMADLSPIEIQKIIRDNAIGLFGLPHQL